MFTELEDITLWYDGECSVSPELLEQFMGIPKLHVTSITEEIAKYNQFAKVASKLSVKTELNDIASNWNIPQEYVTKNLDDYILDKLCDSIEGLRLSDDDVMVRVRRVETELKLFARLNMLDILRTLIYIINMFDSNNVVWGPGRGSSVSSYVLYLIGVHDVDSVKFELDIHDFVH